MKPSLIQHLRCPVTGLPLSLHSPQTADGEIVSGVLEAEGREYPIVGGVPQLLVREKFAPGQSDTRESFSEKWKRAPEYREKTRGHYVQWYLDRYGFRSEAGLEKFLSGFSTILDAGTGHGRDSELYARHSNATVFGIDLSDGIYNAYRDLGSIPNLHLAQADLTRLPFPKDFFDFVACDQVIHHTPNTRESFHALVSHVKPGGHIAIYTYKVKAPAREFCDDHIRKTTVEMSPDDCMQVSEAITKFGKSLSDMKVEIDVPEDIPLLGIKAGKHDLQRFIYWHMFKCYWNDTMDYESNVITNFDWYHPRHAHRHTPAEVRSWFDEAGIEIVHFDIADSGISVLGNKGLRAG